MLFGFQNICIFFKYLQRFIFHLYFIHEYITCIFIFIGLFHVQFKFKVIIMMSNQTNKQIIWFIKTNIYKMKFIFKHFQNKIQFVMEFCN
jgi:hypothetical protein